MVSRVQQSIPGVVGGYTSESAENACWDCLLTTEAA